MDVKGSTGVSADAIKSMEKSKKMPSPLYVFTLMIARVGSKNLLIPD